MSRRVVITGMGAVTPLGLGAETLFRRWAAGECGIEDGEAACDRFEADNFLSRKERRRSDRFTQFALVASDQALEASGLPESSPYETAEVGCIIGTGIGGLGSLEREHNVLRERGPRKISALSVPLMMGNAAAAAVAMRHCLRGQTFGVVSACAAGAHAIGTAVAAIRSGSVDAVVAGGSEAALTPLAEAAFAKMGAISEVGISRPFDRRRDGFVMGEGAGILVLEEAEAAQRRGAVPTAEILGYGATSDAYHLTAPEPAGSGAALAIEMALQDAGVEPSDLDYVNAHGTSTPLNDRSETEALKRALGPSAGRIPVSSTKSTVGHLLGAAGAVEAIATASALKDRLIPPTLGYEEPDEGLDLDYVPGDARAIPNPNGRRAIGISNSFGFGGHNAVLCLGSV